MRVSFFSTKPYDSRYFKQANVQASTKHVHDLHFVETRLSVETSQLAEGSEAVCAFVNDVLSADVLESLHGLGVKYIALRSAGFNHVDLEAANRLEMPVVRVPAYSPHAVAEHAVALLLGLNRRIPRAYNRVRDGNFSLDGLIGFDLYGKTIGLVGTGIIGRTFAEIMRGFGCKLIAFDPQPDQELSQEMDLQYVDLDELFRRSDILSLHCPLTPETHHLINAQALEKMRDGVVLINTSRGRIVETKSVIEALKSGKLGGLAIDVYEEEEDLFFENLSGQVIQDDVFSRLLTFPNVLITGHQGFFTREALSEIASTTLANLTELETSGNCENQVRWQG